MKCEIVTCCRCIDHTSGVQVFAIILMVIESIAFGISLVFFLEFSGPIAHEPLHIVPTILFGLNVLTSGLLLYGSFKRKRWMFIPWLVLHCGWTLILVLGPLAGFGGGATVAIVLVLVTMVPGLGLGYMCLVVIALFRRMKINDEAILYSNQIENST